MIIFGGRFRFECGSLFEFEFGVVVGGGNWFFCLFGGLWGGWVCFENGNGSRGLWGWVWCWGFFR